MYNGMVSNFNEHFNFVNSFIDDKNGSSLANILKDISWRHCREINKIGKDNYMAKLCSSDREAVWLRGEVHTPPEYVTTSYDEWEVYDESIFKDPSHVFADISAGIGNLLLPIKERCMKHQRPLFSSDEECERHVLSNIRFCELDKKNYLMTRKRLDPNNLIKDNPYWVCGDALKVPTETWQGVYAFTSNPPFQLPKEGDGAQSSASELYIKFVKYMYSFNARYIFVICPAKWQNMGENKKNNKFLRGLLQTGEIAYLHDHLNYKDVFPYFKGNIRGGISTFLLDKEHIGTTTKVFTHYSNCVSEHPIIYNDDLVVRLDKLKSVWQKAVSYMYETACGSLSDIMYGTSKYGLDYYYDGGSAKNYKAPKNEEFEGCAKIHMYEKGKQVLKYIDRAFITKDEELIDTWKVFVSKANQDISKLPMKVCPNHFVGAPNEISSYTYNQFGSFSTKEEAENLNNALTNSYIINALIIVNVSTQDFFARQYASVPNFDWKTAWTDELLMKELGITEEEMESIKEIVKIS